jgi:DNA-binding NtrC family response regulator
MKAARVLLADDDASLRRVVEFTLSEAGYAVDTATSGRSALRSLEQRAYEAVVTDLKMPDADGLAVLATARRLHPATPVILMTAYATVETAVEAMRRGAYDYVTKPFDRSELRAVVARALESSRLRGASVAPEGEGAGGFRPEALILGESVATRALIAHIRRVATTDATVLISGESGTGKELVARALHQGGPRRCGPFVVVNCGAIPRDLLETELFGHVRGAFTGALRDKIGKFEQASGGTLFLDELGELTLELQVKLLRALQEHEIERVGEGKPRRVDVRIVAATNRDLEAMVAKGEFREDLYYRIAVIPIPLPPLRERREDVPLLVHHFMQRFANGSDVAISAEAMAALSRAPWRGNVRQLMNVCERIVTLRRGATIELADLPREVLGAAEASSGAAVTLPSGGASLDEVIRTVLVQALERNAWNKTRAARFLQIPRHILLYRMEKYGIPASSPAQRTSPTDA